MEARNERRGGVLEQLTLTEVVELWVEGEINKRLQEVEHFHAEIIFGALSNYCLQVMPLRGGTRDKPRSIEVLVEVRDQVRRRSRIGAWSQSKRTGEDREAFRLAYDKAMAHAIIQLLPACTWRPWIRACADNF